jgi:hypothetical protein
MRAGLIVLGLGLLVLWLVGLNSDATGWLTWLDFLGGLASLATAAMPGLSVPGEAGALPVRESSRAAVAPLLIGVGLLGLWIAGLIARATPWLTWWNFAFGIAFGLLGSAIGAAVERRRPGPRPI